MVIETFDPVETLTRDLRLGVLRMTPQEARYLVDYYYIQQENRKRADNQVLAMGQEPHEIIGWLSQNTRIFENNIRKALGAYSQSQPVGQWAESNKGIGPVISAGLLAHIDIAKAPYAGHIWNFAGLNPETIWEKGQKRPWNASLKTLCWKIGESFVKVSGHADAYYGQLYGVRRQIENARNEAGELADQAAAKLERFKVGKDTEAYKWYIQGKLPPAHLYERSKRWVVKLFLSHWHFVAYVTAYGIEPASPYAIAYLDHGKYIRPPNWPM